MCRQPKAGVLPGVWGVSRRRSADRQGGHARRSVRFVLAIDSLHDAWRAVSPPRGAAS